MPKYSYGYSVKINRAIHFVLLILTFSIVSLSQIEIAHSHGTAAHANVWLDTDQYYVQNEDEVPSGKVIFEVRRQLPQGIQSLTTSVRVKIIAVEGLSSEASFSTKENNNYIGVERTITITDDDVVAAVEIPIMADSTVEDYDDLDTGPNWTGKQTISVEILPAMESDDYHVIGSPDARQPDSCELDQNNLYGKRGPRCKKLYFSINDDDDLPLVSFKPSDQVEFSESDETQFTLQLSKPASNPIEVRINNFEEGGTSRFIKENNSTVTIPAGETELAVGVLIDDERIEPKTKITIEIVRHNTASQLTFRGEGTEFEFTAFSEDGAIASMSSETKRELIESEGSINVKFAVTIPDESEINHISPLLINYSITEESEDEMSSFFVDDFATENLQVSFDLIGEEREADVIIPLDDDNTEEGDGTITVIMKLGDNYMVPVKPDDRISFQVMDDDDDKKQVELKAYNSNDNNVEISQVNAGEIINFRVNQVNTTGWQPLTVDINVIQQGNVILWRVPNRVRFAEYDLMEDINIATRRGVVPDNASISLQVFSGQGFTLKMPDEPDSNTSTLPIQVVSSEDDSNKISVAANAVNAILSTINPENGNSPQSQLIERAEISQTNPLIPVISLSVDQLQINEGENVVIQLSSSLVVSKNTQIKIEVIGNSIEPDQIAIADIKSGQNTGMLSVPTINDSKPNPDRIISVNLQAGSGYELGSKQSISVEISDAEDQNHVRNLLLSTNQAVLPDVFSTMGSQTLDAVDGRVKQYFNHDVKNSLIFDGSTQFNNILTSSGKTFANDSLSIRDVLSNSSFAFNLFEESNIPNSTTIWGLGEIKDISGNLTSKQQTWDGDTFIGQFGFDTRIGEEALTGVAYSVSDAEVNFVNRQDDEIFYKSKTSGLHPYFGWKSDHGGIELSVQTGYGIGEIEIEYEDIYRGALGTKYYTVAVEGSKNIATSEDFLTGINSELNFVFDSEFLQQNLTSRERLIGDTQIEFWNINLATEGKQSSKISENVTFDRSFTLSLVQKYNNTEIESGIGTSSSVEFTKTNGLQVSGLGRIILPYENQVRGSIQGSLSFDHNQDQLGTQFELLGSYGSLDSSDHAIFTQNNLDYLDSYNFAANEINQRLVSEIGYGFAVFDGLGSIVPYSGFTLTNGLVSDFQLGGILQLGSNFELELVSKNRDSTSGISNQSIEFDGKFKW